MMKKVILLASVFMIAGFTFAQKKEVKRAKSIEKTEEARKSIAAALEHEETANDPEAWKVAGDIEYKAFDAEKVNEMTKELNKGKGGNADIMYNALHKMYPFYVKADELGEQPDAKGKIKNKVRKDIRNAFQELHLFYINGGSHFNDKKEFAKATDLFEMYWNIPTLPMFAENNPFVIDSTYQGFKYYAIICAIQSKNTDRSIKLLNRIIEEPYIQNSIYDESAPYELLASELQGSGDSIQYVETLKKGALKFPKNQYFTPNLINEFIKAKQAKQALDYLDQAIINDPESACELYGVKGSLLINEKQYDEAVVAYEAALAKDENCEKALEGFGIYYVLLAQESKDKIGQVTNKQELLAIDKKTIEYYEKSLPLLEKFVSLLKARDADFDMDVKPALQKLHHVYYNLGILNVDKEAEFSKISKELGLE